MSKKKTDANGFVTFRDCKFFCECVTQYLGKEIDDGTMGLRPNGIYNVYRPKDEIAKKEFIESLNAKPLLDDHHVIGNVNGMASPDSKREAGVLTEVRLDGNSLVGRIDVWSPALLEKIRRGKKELSLAYSCDFVRRKGVFHGERYDFVQSNLRCGNHLALVDEARNGHDCRVADGTLVRDETIKLEKPDMDISKLSADEVVEALKGCSDEVRAACKDAIAEYKETEKLAADCKPLFGEISMDSISTRADLVKHICDMKIDTMHSRAISVQNIIKDSKPEVAIAALRGALASAGAEVKRAVVKDAKASDGKVSFAAYMASNK